jgi:sugar lactone lactonase YvrE
LGLLGCAGPEPKALDCADPGVICTIAGIGSQGYNGQDLPALETALYFPSALAWTADGRLLIDDFNNFLIRSLDEDGRLSTFAGSQVHDWAVEGPASESPLENPSDLAAGPDGEVYIAELHSGRVLKVDEAGELSFLAGTGDIGYSGDGGPAREALLSELWGVAADEAGNVYVADTDNHCLRRIRPDGTIETLAGDGQPGFAGEGSDLGSALFHRPLHLRAAGDQLLVADSGNHAVRLIELGDGSIHTVAGTGLPGYSGDGGPGDSAQLSSPTSAAFGPDGAVYIADSGNHRVRRVGPDGQIETWAGTGEAGLAGDGGPAEEAALQWPADILFDDEGALYIADMKNGVVRRVSPGR